MEEDSNLYNLNHIFFLLWVDEIHYNALTFDFITNKNLFNTDIKFNTSNTINKDKSILNKPNFIINNNNNSKIKENIYTFKSSSKSSSHQII